jgi:type III secretion protein S
MPAIVVASVVGVAVALVQALTQVQEQTLSFAIKLFAIIVTLIVTANWLGVTLYDYAIRLFDLIPEV